MRVCDLPGYDPSGEEVEMDTRYVSAVRQILKKRKMATVLKLLKRHIVEWRAFWELGQDKVKFPGVLRKIAKLDIHREDIRRLRSVANNRKFIPKASDKVAMCIFLPPTMLHARLLANEFEVPFCIALHQGFCREAEHENCF
jgi:hypothetical protein